MSRTLPRRSVSTAAAEAVSVSDMRGSLRFAAMRPTVLITGATDGLGRGAGERLRAGGARGRRLAGRRRAAGARGLVHGRDEQRLAAIGGETFLADFSSPDEVRRLAD